MELKGKKVLVTGGAHCQLFSLCEKTWEKQRARYYEHWGPKP